MGKPTDILLALPGAADSGELSVVRDKVESVLYKIKWDDAPDNPIVFSLADDDDNPAMDSDTWANVQVNIVFPVNCQTDQIRDITKDACEIFFEIGRYDGKEMHFTLEGIAEGIKLGTVRCSAKVDDEGSTATMKVVNEVKAPKVLLFAADKTMIKEGQDTMLQWKTENVEGMSVMDGDRMIKEYKAGDPAIKEGRTNTGRLLGSGINRRFLLLDSSKNELARADVLAYGSDTFARLEGAFGPHSLMALYVLKGNISDTLYALVLHDEGTPAANVYMWESDNGLNWRQSMYNDRPVGFMGGRVSVPLDAAGSGGAIVGTRLYLVGGSRYDSDLRSNKVYYYDFANRTAGWVAGNDAPFDPASGIACVAYNSSLWAIGGLADDGARTGVWEYDGSNWHQRPSLPVGKGMASAVVHKDRIVVYGGFGEMAGSADQQLKENSYRLEQHTWKKTEWAGKNDDSRRLQACAAVSHEGKQLLFCSFNSGGTIQHYCYMVNEPDNTLTELQRPLLMQESAYSIQAVSFRNAVWICMHAVGNNTQPELHYFFKI